MDDDIVEVLVKNTGGAGPKTRAAIEALLQSRDGANARDFGVVGDGAADDTTAMETIFGSVLPDFQVGWGSNNNFDVSGVPTLTLAPGSIVNLTRQIVIDEDKAFELRSPAKGGARIVYTGASTRTDGATTSGSKTLTGTGFTSADVGCDIAVRGAGDGGSTLVTWVQSFTSATQVQLAHAAGTTATGRTYILRFSAFRKGGERNDKRGIPYTFRNLVFHYGGMVFNNGTKPVTVEHCDFHNTLGPALTALNKANVIGGDANAGTGAVTYKATELLFNHCWGGYWQLAATAGLNKLTHSRFNASRDISIVLAAGFHNIQQVDFQGMEATAGDTLPSMWLPSATESGGRSRMDDLRFGSEIFTEGGASFEPPFAGMVIGPLGRVETSPGATRPEDLRLGRLWFGGSVAPSDTSAKHAILLNKAVEGMSIDSGKFGVHNAALIQEAGSGCRPGATGTPCSPATTSTRR